MTEQVRGGPEGVALPSIILRCSVISTRPSMTEKVRGGPEGVALPSIIPRDPLAPNPTQNDNFQNIHSKESPGNAG